MGFSRVFIRRRVVESCLNININRSVMSDKAEKKPPKTTFRINRNNNNRINGRVGAIPYRKCKKTQGKCLN